MNQHQAVLLQEAISGLAIKPEGIYIDCTFGRGGHSGEILARLGSQGYLYAIDKDLEAIAFAEEKFGQDSRFKIFHGSYAKIADFAAKEGFLGKVDGILLDLGVSSPQLDNPERGFSFIHEGPLDMRMDKTQNLSAERFINSAKEEEMVEIFRTYGEERFSGRIARAIIKAREEDRITTTRRLAEIVKEANPKWEKHKHPATRVFQAIRIHVNDELRDLKQVLKSSMDVLKPGGRLAVISFHSLEDRIVKQFMRDREQGEKLPPNIPIKAKELETDFKRIGKAIMPGEAETEHNVRARSAVLRIGEKLK